MPCIHPSECPPLGWLVPCFAVADLKASIEFYETLGFSVYGGNVEESWAMLRNRAIEIHLFEGHIQHFRNPALIPVRLMRPAEHGHASCGVDIRQRRFAFQRGMFLTQYSITSTDTGKIDGRSMCLGFAV